MKKLFYIQVVLYIVGFALILCSNPVLQAIGCGLGAVASVLRAIQRGVGHKWFLMVIYILVALLFTLSVCFLI